MRFDERPRRPRPPRLAPPRLAPCLRRLSLVVLIIGALCGVATSPAEPAAAQTTSAPDRPLVVIGGTFADSSFTGYDSDLDYEGGFDRDGDGSVEGEIDVGGWPDVSEWLEGHGYVSGETLFVGQMAELSAPPPNWSSSPLAVGWCGDHWQWNGNRWVWTGPCNGWTWDEFVQVVEGPDGPGGLGGSTAGLVDMNTSVQAVKTQLQFYWAITGGQQIDVAAHSQGAAITRAAIKQLEAEATAEDQDGDPEMGNHDIVHTMISLGGAHYGIPVASPEFRIPFFSWYSTAVVRDCRNDGWLPVCPHIVRDYSDPAGVYLQPNPYNPDNPDWDVIHRTPFYPDLNALTGSGPTPGNTRYYHVYSNVFTPGGGVELYAPETIELHDDGNTDNWLVQGWCTDTTHAVHHVAEWVEPATQEMILAALQGRTPDLDGIC